jgi:hypothetical protein
MTGNSKSPRMNLMMQWLRLVAKGAPVKVEIRTCPHPLGVSGNTPIPIESITSVITQADRIRLVQN